MMAGPIPAHEPTPDKHHGRLGKALETVERIF